MPVSFEACRKLLLGDALGFAALACGLIGRVFFGGINAGFIAFRRVKRFRPIDNAAFEIKLLFEIDHGFAGVG